MAIATMGVRSALSTEQEQYGREYFRVIDSLAASNLQKTTGGPKVPEVGTQLASAIEKISAWIPSETLALWLAVASAGELFEHSNLELSIGGLMTVSSGVFAGWSSLSAHKRRGRRGAGGKAVKTGFVAAFAFFIYWMAMPGSIATDEWKLPGLLAALIALVVALFLPLMAQALKIEPITTPNGNAEQRVALQTHEESGA